MFAKNAPTFFFASDNIASSNALTISSLCYEFYTEIINNLQLLIKLNEPYCDFTMQSLDIIMAKLLNDRCLFIWHTFLQSFGYHIIVSIMSVYLFFIFSS